jgi:hypothetical protein
LCARWQSNIPAAEEQFERAALHLETEADALNEAAEMLFPGWELPQEANREINDKTAALLQTARDSYARAIDEIESALGAMGVTAS